MGCAQSRVDDAEAVTRCRERKQWMKAAVTARNAFAAAHSAYAVALKDTGAALGEFSQSEYASAPASSSSTAAAGQPPTAASTAAVQSPMDNLPPPPPPLPDFSPSPLQRSISMPDLPPSKMFPSRSPLDASIREEEEDEELAAAEDDHDDGGDRGDRDNSRRRRPAAASPFPPAAPPPPPKPAESSWDYFFGMDEDMPSPSLGQPMEIRPEREKALEESIRSSAPPPPPPPAADHDVVGADGDPPMTPEKVVLEPPSPPKAGKNQKQNGTVHHQHVALAPPIDAKRGKMVAFTAPSVDLQQVLTSIDDHFLKASESAHEVTKILEATRLHYHSNFADNRGHIDHSARVMQVITWNRSFKGIPYADDRRDDFDNDEWETHATVLDKMLAWEKKLYDEVKAGELMKIEYQRKVALLNRQKKRDASAETLGRTKAAVSHLHTRYIVDMQSMDSTVLEIEYLRDKQLYPKLMDLVDGMAKMWEAMCMHHDNQLKLVLDLKIVDLSNDPKETSERHHKRTSQLFGSVKKWHLQLEKLMNHQKDYIQALNSWLKLNVISIENSLKEKVSSPPRPHQPPVQALLYAWHDHLEKLPDELAKSSILSFSAVIDTILTLQQEELKQKEKCDEIRKEYVKKTRAFEDWYSKYSQRRAALSEEAGQEGTEGANQNDPVSERKFALETLKSRLDDEEENHKKLCKQVMEKSFGSLKTHLPELFRSLSDFARSSSNMYMMLKSVSQAQNPIAN